jgi:hypothetical protein
MHIVDDPAQPAEEPKSPAPPVMNERWAEAVVDLRRERSRRRHPSNREPAWEKDGGYDPSEWVV